MQIVANIFRDNFLTSWFSSRIKKKKDFTKQFEQKANKLM